MKGFLKEIKKRVYDNKVVSTLGDIGSKGARETARLKSDVAQANFHTATIKRIKNKKLANKFSGQINTLIKKNDYAAVRKLVNELNK